jgi:hypothetical protein
VDDVDSLKGVIRQMVPKAIEDDGNHGVKAGLWCLSEEV